MTSHTMCLIVLSHVLKDSILHLIRRGSTSRHGRSFEGPLTHCLRWRHAMRLCSHEGRRRALLKIELIQSVETVLRSGDAQAEGLFVKRARLDGIGDHITRAPGRQHVRIIGFGERE